MSPVSIQGGGGEGRAGRLWEKQGSPGAWSAPANMSVVSTHETRQLAEDAEHTHRKFFERERLGPRKRPGTF